MIKFIIPLFRENEKITKQYTRLLNNKIVTQYMVETLEEIKKTMEIDYEIWTNIEEFRTKFDRNKIRFFQSADEVSEIKSEWYRFINPNYPFVSEKTYFVFIEKKLKTLTFNKHVIICDNFSQINEIIKTDFFEVQEMNSLESINLETRSGWWIAEKELKKKRIIIHPLSSKALGTGHIYRGLTIGSKLLIDHDVLFLFRKDQELGINMIRREGFKVLTYDVYENPADIIIMNRPDIVINDLLNTTKDYILKLKQANIRVINFEDIGEGAIYADAVINALYPGNVPQKNFYTGEDYYCIREDFIGISKKTIKKDVEEILITYGGEDPQFLTLATLKGIYKLQDEFNFHITIILGPAFNNHEKLYKAIMEMGLENKISVYENVNEMVKFMKRADIIFTSAGRTMYEIATVGTPAVVTSQNYREITHTFGHPYNGFYNLGYWAEVNEDNYYNVARELILDFGLRQLMNERMRKNDFSEGINRVVKIILNEECENNE